MNVDFRDALVRSDIAQLKEDTICIDSDDADDDDEQVDMLNTENGSPITHVSTADALAELLSDGEEDDEEDETNEPTTSGERDATVTAPAGETTTTGEFAFSPPLLSDELMLEAASCASEPSMPATQHTERLKHFAQLEPGANER